MSIGVECSVCGERKGMSGTLLCDNCWELSWRLEHSNAKALEVFKKRVEGLEMKVKLEKGMSNGS